MLTERFAEILESLDSPKPDLTSSNVIYTHESYELKERGLIDRVGNMILVTPRGRSTLFLYKVLKSIESLRYGEKSRAISSQEVAEHVSMEVYRVNHILYKLAEENYIKIGWS